MITTSEKVRENYLRRKATRLGFFLKKSRGKKWKIHDRQGYMIIDTQFNSIECGQDFDLSIEDVEKFLAESELLARKQYS